uniref:Ankyrin repeat domain-containing protein n=1 Tax=Alexandrium catenella TaxID=2925 RepID=A0A7S1LK03_ALECA|mmetsp:Transcript_115146/g.306143  ORF Transcript_115146/g.306143 Transcript_115146/m.306143 type:complete len:222 (+) Transcript_115146:87-752(+)
MPSKNVTQEMKAKMFPPDGVPCAKNMKPDDYLMQACDYGCNVPALERALAKKANVNARDKSGKTPLMLAAQNWTHPKYTTILEKLLEKGAEVNVESEYGETVMDIMSKMIVSYEAAREKEVKDQAERREIMEGRGPIGWGYGTAEDQKKTVIWNRPAVDELDDFKMMPQLYKGKALLEAKGAKAGEEAFNPAYLTAEEFVEKRDKVLAKYKDKKYKMYNGQ